MNPRAASPQSVGRIVGIMEVLAGGRAPLGLAAISRALGAPKSSVASLLRGLETAGYVVSGEAGWELGSSAFGLGSALLEARRGRQSSELIRQGMNRLVERTGETALFAVRDEDGATLTYVDVIESSNAVRFFAAVGDRAPLYCTAAGRMLLAAGPEDLAERYYELLRGNGPLALSTIARTRLAAAVAEARRAGVAQTIDEAAAGVTGTAAPIRDARGMVIGALAIAAPTSRLADHRAELADHVRSEALAISRALGFRDVPANPARGR